MAGHFSELLLSFLLMVSLGFLLFASKVHNDQLAQWGQSIAGQLLAALLTLMVSGSVKKTPDSPPKEPPQ